MRYSTRDYFLYFSVRFLEKVFAVFPLGLALFLGKAVGLLGYFFDRKHKRVAYRNLRIAFASEKSPSELKAILKKIYLNLGMNLIEVLIIPRIDKDYLDKYIKIQGEQFIEEAAKEGKGIIFISTHFGNWEILFATAGILGYPVYLFADEQRKSLLLDNFLNRMRKMKGLKVLKAGSDLRRLLRILREKKMVGMIVDHGIKEGVFVDFFGRKTRTPTIAIRLALRLNIPVVPAYIHRCKGPNHEFVILPSLKLKRTGVLNQDIALNLGRVNSIVENYIRKYPSQYHWFYKRFKYSRGRNILVLCDDKTGHLRQSEALVKLIENTAKQRQLEIKTKLVRVDFKNKPDSFKELQSYFADIVISCGSSLAPVNLVISSENQAKSIVIMRPGFLSTKSFDLVIMPKHDNPPQRENIVVTEGALNLINEEYLKVQISSLKAQGVNVDKKIVVGLLLGGDTKNFKLSLNLLRPIISQIKLFLENYDAQILITTSRRSSPEVEGLIKEEFNNYSRCKLLVIASEKNIPEAVGGILGLSNIVVVSPESISMISEAVTAGRHIVVLEPQEGLGKRHKRFLEYFTSKGYIYLVRSYEIADVLKKIAGETPTILKLSDNQRVKVAIEKLL